MKSEVPFLLDESDTVLAYENRGRTQPFGQDPLMAFLGSVDHVQQLEMIYREFWPLRTRRTRLLIAFAHVVETIPVNCGGKETGYWSKSEQNKKISFFLDYNDLKTELTTFLQQYATEGKVRTDLKINDVVRRGR